jgi:hypothetical protein
MDKLISYLLNLGFYPGRLDLGPDLRAGRLWWSLMAYFLLVLGLLSQQCTNLANHPIELSLSNLNWSVLAASSICGIALFPPMMVWFNKKAREPSWRHLLWAFSFGFFIDLSGNLLWKQFIR